MEDYKEKYEMALEKAKILLSKCKRVSDKASMIYRAEDIENMFPEFQKPEEEKIKEALIELVKCNERSGYTLLNNVSTSSMINWLEKQDKQNSNILWHDVTEEPEEQRELFCEWKGYTDVWYDIAFYHPSNKTFWNGEQQIENVVKWAYIDEMLNKSNPYSGVSFQYNSHIWGMCARDNGVEISIDNELKAFVSIDKSFIYPIHPQPYLAPKSASQAIKEIITDNANKIEPKFHEGDWVATNKGDAVQIGAVNNGYYTLFNGMDFDMSYVDKYWHKWTIQDAKEGDVLAGKIDGDSYILIYKQIKDGWIETYGHYYDSIDRFCVPSQLFCREVKGTFRPTTKEQKEFLFQKMRKAGYEWDADKKKIIKL